MINELIKLATHLDNKGLTKEADYVDALIKRAGAWSDVTDAASDIASGIVAAGTMGPKMIKLIHELTTEFNRNGRIWTTGWLHLAYAHKENLMAIYERDGIHAAAAELVRLHSGMS